MNDVVSLGVGSVTGAVVSELLKLVIEEAKMVLAFKSVYKELASTMEDVLPTIIEIEMLQGAEELKKLKDIIDEALVLVRKCSKVNRWNIPSQAKYARKIIDIDKRMLKFCQIQLQLIMLRNQRLYMRPPVQNIRPPVQNMRPPVQFWSAPPRQPFSSPTDRTSDMSSDVLSVHRVKALESHLQRINKKLDVLSVSPHVYKDLCSVPKLDKVLVGLDLPLMEIKKKLLDDDDVVSLVVSAPPGCGKTTLVTQLCHEHEII
ncbi:unnamed protein product, partial [Eruca vesicaria subsp. sativa]|nr:unnamed protein product [Eruca vesicaria subsp. sativa]